MRRLNTVLAMAWLMPLQHQVMNGQAPSSDVPKAVVRFSIVGPFGEKLDTPRVQFLTVDRKKDLAPTPDATSISAVPFGEYILKASHSGCCPAERRVLVNADEIWIKLGVPIRYGDADWEGGFLKIKGTLSPAPRDTSRLWVKVQGVFLDFSREALVDREGRFSVGGLDMGTYSVEVFDGAKLLRATVIEIDTKQPETDLTLSVPPG